MPRLIEVQLHQVMQLDTGKRRFYIRKITGAIAADLNGRRFFTGDSLDEKQADELAGIRNYKVSVMADKS
jgi:hypothetical protein